MGRFQKIGMVLVLLLCLTGCNGNPGGSVRVVGAVDVVCDRGGQILHRHYTRPEKMETILKYLRLQEDLGPAEADPEHYAGERIRINITLTDGTRRVYYQCAGKFLSRQLRPWQQIDPGRAAEFSQKLTRMPTDKENPCSQWNRG